MSAEWSPEKLVGHLERGDVSAVWPLLAEDVKRVLSPESLSRWGAELDAWIGAPRAIARIDETGDANAERVLLHGPHGSVAVTVRLDAGRLVTAVELTPWVADGIRNIVIGSPGGSWNEEAQRVEGEPRALAEFYADLLGLRIVREDWMKVGKDGSTFPHLAFGDGWSDERPPRWPDPDYSPQLHLDLFASDPSAAGNTVLKLGGRKLRDGGTHAVYADPFGHALCLFLDRAPESVVPRVGRVVLDCADPGRLAEFYAALLDMHRRIEEAPDRVVIGREDGSLPMLAFQRVTPYVPPRWHDPRYPAQVHLDLHFNEVQEARQAVERLGATELPPPRGSCPVYADPAGHPFCLCSNVGGEEPYVVQFLRGP